MIKQKKVLTASEMGKKGGSAGRGASKIRWSLKMKHYAKIIEDNAGGLTMYIMDEHDKCVFAHSGYEYVSGQLSEDIKALLADDSCADWDGNEPEIADGWDALEYGNEYKITGLELVAETNDSGLHTYPHRMGGAARSEFGVDNNNE